MRKIIHIDMDCYFAQVEERENPKYKSLPIAIGGSPESRSVLCTANYVARKFGVRAAITSAKAISLCPDLILLKPRFLLYKEISKEIHKIFRSYTNLVQPLSLDEAFLDVTEQTKSISATQLAQEIRSKIYESVQLTASAGISSNKLLAKIASDLNKPNGQFVIKPHEIEKFMLTLDVKKIPGVGKTTLKKMEGLNIKTCKDLQSFSIQDLHLHFGNFSKSLYRYSRGIDERKVEPYSKRKTLSVETTFQGDHEIDFILEQIPKLLKELTRRMNKSEIKEKNIKNIHCKLKFFDFTSSTMTISYEQIDIKSYKKIVLKAFENHLKPVRLLGLGISLKEQEIADENQLSFLEQLN